MCSVKTVESVPSVWRICYRERPLPGWLVSVSTIRGNTNQRVHFCYGKMQTDFIQEAENLETRTGDLRHMARVKGENLLALRRCSARLCVSFPPGEVNYSK